MDAPQHDVSELTRAVIAQQAVELEALRRELAYWKNAAATRLQPVEAEPEPENGSRKRKTVATTKGS